MLFRVISHLKANFLFLPSLPNYHMRHHFFFFFFVFSLFLNFPLHNAFLFPSSTPSTHFAPSSTTKLGRRTSDRTCNVSILKSCRFSHIRYSHDKTIQKGGVGGQDNEVEVGLGLGLGSSFLKLSFLSLVFALAPHIDITSNSISDSFRPPVVLADSTGKYSTKATAKKRYLPRLKKAVVEFKNLGESIANGPNYSVSVDVKEYNERIETSYGTALSLYGSSTRSGEYLDDQAREVQDILKQFISDSKSLSKATDKPQAKQLYEKMKGELESFLSLCKLEGDINAEYYTKDTPPPSTPLL